MYRFKRPHRQFKQGDPVPESLGSGAIQTMLTHNIIELMVDQADKAITRPPADKSMSKRKGKMTRKAVSA